MRDADNRVREELASVGDERAGRGAVHDEFAHRTQHQEAEEAADGVDGQQGGPSRGESATRAHEQAGSDRAADRDHLDLPGLEPLVVALFLLREQFLQMRFGLFRAGVVVVRGSGVWGRIGWFQGHLDTFV